MRHRIVFAALVLLATCGRCLELAERGNHKAVLGEGLKLYPNLYTMVKFNGESLTTWQPRGRVEYENHRQDLPCRCKE